MNVLHEILKWSEELPDWQSDAIARLFNKTDLESEDIDDIYALLKSQYGIPDPKKRPIHRLTADQISIPVPPGKKVQLVSLKNLLNVNAIAKNQKLSFGLTGLTIIYGDNGSGKSGYCRVIKKACRARDQGEQILPDANEHSPSRNAEAIFELCVNGQEREEHWSNGIPAHEDLSTIAIFDHHCARAYLDEEDDFSYVPYGMDIFENLAQLCNILKRKIEQDLVKCETNPKQFDDLRGETEVGKLIENLSENTDPNYVETISRIMSEDLDQYEDIRNSLSQNNPLEKADLLHRRSQRIFRIANLIKERLAIVTDSEIDRISKIDLVNFSANKAAKIASENFYNTGEFLPGTGGEIWKKLFEAARKFSELAYPEKIFPNTEEGAKCPLCQQPLKDGASRLRQFEEFIQQETEKKARETQKELDETKRAFFKFDTISNFDHETIDEIALHDQILSKKCQLIEDELNLRFEQISNAFNSHEWGNFAKLSEDPSKNLEILASKLNSEADTLEKAADTTKREILQKKYGELDARVHLFSRKDEVIEVIAKKCHKATLEKCLDAVKTNSISLKAKEIAEVVITHDLSDALNDEFRKMGVDKLKVELKSRSNHGKPMYKLKLNLPFVENPSKILSEGEQRAIAISSFLAEVNLVEGSCGIIFDDPISSLDHKRRERVAKRFVEEAKKRQVIIFTHDIYFLSLLIEEAENNKVPFESNSLIKKANGFGIPETGNPFQGKSTKERIGYLRSQHQEILKIFNEGNEHEHSKKTFDAYQYLRDSWERAIEEVLLQNVVLRFRKGIETQRLRRVTVEDSDFSTVENGMTKCSKYCHDTASICGITIPDPAELLEDINSLDEWRLSIIKRSEVTDKRRK